MRSRVVILGVLAALAAVILVIGIVAVAGAEQPNPLPAVSASDLLAKMAQQDQQTTSISGAVAWQNGLLGDLSALTGASGMHASASLPLVSNGSGRVWMSDGGARIESQASGGDQIMVVNNAKREAWMYDYAANTAKHIVVTGTPAGGTAPSPVPTPAMATPAAIDAFLQQVSQYADVSVTGQGVVAGRDVYFLSMTPTAPDTALGSVQAAVDGKTYVPLQLQVFAKGGASPVIKFGFSSVSYDSIAASTYDFVPPAGTKVTTKTVDLSKASTHHKGIAGGHMSDPTTAQKSQMQQLLQRALLTVPEAQKLVPFQLASAQGYTARPFDWAAVVDKGGPLTAVGKPLAALLQASGVFGGTDQTKLSRPHGTGLGTSTATAARMGPTAVLLYGKGFGTIVLAETATTPALQKQIEQLPALVDKTSVNGSTVRSFTTPLGGVYVWQKGDTTLVAGGMVTKADLQTFVSSVQ